MFKDELLASDVSERQITFINFEEPEMVTAAYKWREVYDEILAKLQPRHMNYIFLDEVQAVDGWEKMVDGLHAKKITTVMVKDVIARQGGGNVKTATNIMWFMLDNI
ncbi:MAG: AAA family ATPase, partial [Coriobacteriales bacterium]|nr:AAA family ATPase [Coriobacteriales bacterium]